MPLAHACGRPWPATLGLVKNRTLIPRLLIFACSKVVLRVDRQLGLSKTAVLCRFMHTFITYSAVYKAMDTARYSTWRH